MNAIQAFRKLKYSIMIMLLLSLLLIFGSSLYAADHSVMILNSNLHTSDDLNERLDEYKEIVEELDEQIKDQIDAIDWLYLKMERINDSERELAINLVRSIEKKNFTIKRLSKEKKRYDRLVKSLFDEIKKRKQTRRSGNVQEQAMKIYEGKQKSEKIIKHSVQNIVQDSFDRTRLISEIEKANLSDWLEITEDGSCLRLTTTLPILFPVGSAKIANEYKSFFMRLANILKVYDVKIMVKGYADIDPINTKKYPSNFELGAIRAANVVHELINNGLKPSIFDINSPGKYRFSANGELKQKALERRAEVIIVFTG